VRLPESVQILWIHAVCINQPDVAERDAQVKIMVSIYQSAKEVLVWLGPDSEVCEQCTISPSLLSPALWQFEECRLASNCSEPMNRSSRNIEIYGTNRLHYATADSMQQQNAVRVVLKQELMSSWVGRL
jgi:hypothetical protein